VRLLKESMRISDKLGLGVVAEDIRSSDDKLSFAERGWL
jgi:hypothetical protein